MRFGEGGEERSIPGKFLFETMYLFLQLLDHTQEFFSRGLPGTCAVSFLFLGKYRRGPEQPRGSSL